MNGVWIPRGAGSERGVVSLSVLINGTFQRGDDGTRTHDPACKYAQPGRRRTVTDALASSEAGSEHTRTAAYGWGCAIDAPSDPGALREPAPGEADEHQYLWGPSILAAAQRRIAIAKPIVD
jgi:hypothetical protein